jgi:hypothetical protein
MPDPAGQAAQAVFFENLHKTHPPAVGTYFGACH